MTWKVESETLDAVRRRLTVEIPAEAVQSEVDAAYSSLARSARVPGFRPGRAPRRVLERMFGDSVRADVYSRLISKSLAEAVEEQHIHALGTPEIVTETQLEPGAVLRYSATFEVRPELTDVRYKGLNAQRPVLEVPETEVDARLERLRQSLAQLHPIEDRTRVEAGDVVHLDYEARVAGRIVSKAENRDVEVGANPFPAEFDAHLLGAEAGQGVSFAVAYGADGPPEVAGKTVDFQVTVHRLSRKELPVLDDDFAKDHGECDTIAELRARVRGQLEAEATRMADESMRHALLGELAKANDIPIPTALVHRRTQALVDDVREDWHRQRITPKSEADAVARLAVELEPRAREQVKIGMLLDAIAHLENVLVRDDEVDARIEEIASDSGAAAERVRAIYQGEDARRQLHARLLQARTIDAVVAHAVVTNVAPASRVADAAENG